jgi:hypothetical protein
VQSHRPLRGRQDQVTLLHEVSVYEIYLRVYFLNRWTAPIRELNRNAESAVRMPSTPPDQTFLISVYYPTHALRNRTHVTYINSYIFWHRGAIIRESLQHRRKSQPANIFICQDRVYLYWQVGFNAYVCTYFGRLALCIYWQVGLYTFVVITPWWWHLGAEICRSLCMSCVLYHKVHLLDNILIVKTYTVWIT